MGGRWPASRHHALLPDVEKAVPARATGVLREDRIKPGFQGKAACCRLQWLRESAGFYEKEGGFVQRVLRSRVKHRVSRDR
jgi:hypothetical protein